MKIQLIIPYYYPDAGGTPNLYKELCESLVLMGHDVKVITQYPRYNAREVPEHYQHGLFIREEIKGVKLLRIKTPSLAWNIPATRMIEYIFVAIALFLGALLSKRADVALIYSPVLFVELSALALRKLKRIPCVFNVHDLFPQTAIDLKILKNKFIIRLFRLLESQLYKRANWVTVHSYGNRDWVVKHGGHPSRTSVMPIWMDSQSIKPGSSINSWRSNHNLDGKFVIIFSGTQGYNQDMEVILNAAKRLENNKQIQFVLIGNGTQHNEIVQKSKQMSLLNVKFLDWQPRDCFHLVMRTADVVLATLKKEVSTPVVPSKILSAMSAGRPLIICMPISGDAPKLVIEAKAGIALQPGDDKSLAEAILKLYNDRKLGESLGESGRRYVEEYLDVKNWSKEYVKLFSRLVSE